MIVSAFVVCASQSGGAAILLPWPMAVGMFFLTLLMCVSAALVSINKLRGSILPWCSRVEALPRSTDASRHYSSRTDENLCGGSPSA